MSLREQPVFSVRDWRAVRFARRVVRGVLVRSGIVAAYHRKRRCAALSESIIFDKDFYEAAVGRTFHTRRGAIRHFVRFGEQMEVPFSPLVDLSWIRERYEVPIPPLSWLAELDEPLCTSPLFDSRVYAETEKIPLQNPLQLLDHFLRNVRAETILPATPEIPHAAARCYSEWRTMACHEVTALREREHLRTDSTRPFTEGDRAASIHVRRRLRRRRRRLGELPLVSVIMPVKNRADLVGAAIESVLSQSYPRWELLVIDDGSTDATPDVVRGYAEVDHRVRLLAGHPAGGVSAARNRGIAAASGEYVAFLDSDNQWLPHFLDAQLTGAVSGGHGLSYSELKRFSERGVLLQGIQTTRHQLLWGGNSIDLNVLLVRKDLLERVGGFDESLRRWVDYDLLLRLAEHEEPTLIPFIGVEYSGHEGRHERISSTEPAGWERVVLQKHLVDWEAAVRRPRVAGRISLIMLTYDDWAMTVRAMNSILAQVAQEGLDVEIVLVDNGSHPVVRRTLSALWGTHERVQLLWLPRNLNFAFGSNWGLLHSTGDRVLFINNDVEVRGPWLRALVAELDDPDVVAAQPVLLYGDGTIQCAGTCFGGRRMLPWHYLAGHPVEDIRHARRELPALSAAAILFRADDILALRGFDVIYTNGYEDVDLCLRAAGLRGGRMRVVHESQVTHHESKTKGRFLHSALNRKVFLERWQDKLPALDRELYRAVGFEIVSFAPTATHDRALVRDIRPVLVRPSRLVDEGPYAGRRALRWAIRTAAPSGPKGDSWGDTFFADDLADSLRRLGQEVVIDRRDADDREHRQLDDVFLVLRGLDAVAPVPGAVNILWVISHPESITAAELSAFDAVFAASEHWAHMMSELHGVSVQPLLQAADPEKFRPDRAAEPRGAVFVGSTRGMERPIVLAAEEGGLQPTIYGPGWERTPVASRVVQEFLPPNEVAAVYASAGAVLNDHWPDMARAGFISNRAFEVAAAGGRLISDRVAGLEELFGDAVRTVDPITPEGLQQAYRELSEVRLEVLQEISERVRREHSFLARAVVLVDEAYRVAPYPSAGA